MYKCLLNGGRFPGRFTAGFFRAYEQTKLIDKADSFHLVSYNRNRIESQRFKIFSGLYGSIESVTNGMIVVKVNVSEVDKWLEEKRCA